MTSATNLRILIKKRLMTIESISMNKIDKSNIAKSIITDNLKVQSIEVDDMSEPNIEPEEKVIKETGKKKEKNAIEETTEITKGSKCENGEIKTPANSNVQNHVKPQIVTVEKTEHVHSTPRKTENAHNLNGISSNDEIISGSLKQRGVFSLSLRGLEDLMKSPPTKNIKSPQNKNVTPTSINLEEQKQKQIVSPNDNGKYFCDLNQSFKSELNNIGDFNDSEAIDLLHDLDTVIHFADTKMSSDILSLMPNVHTEHETEDSVLDVYKDPISDPLFINDCENRDANTTSTHSKSTPVVQRRRSRCTKQVNNIDNFFKRKKYNLTKEEKHLVKELENIEKQEEELPLSIIQKLQELRIKLIHEVPPQHKIELTGAHVPTQRDKRLFIEYGPLRKGPFSPMEDKIIRTNWETFCKLHNWDSKNVEQFLYWRHNGRYYIRDINERQKFVQFLANGLPWRTLCSVYSRFKVLYSKKITQVRYTVKEDKKILMYIENQQLNKRSTKFIELAKLLGRTSRSISKRYRYLQQIKNKSKTTSVDIKWTLPLIKKFIKVLLNVTLSDDISELKYATLPKPVWQKMEEKLQIDENVLKTFWHHQLHLQLFSTGPIYLNDIKIQLIEYMYGKGISNTREIIWPNVAQHFDGATAVFLCRTFFYLVQECDINEMNNFADTVEFLYHSKIPEIKKAPTDKFLPRIKYKNGKIEILNTESADTEITSDATPIRRGRTSSNNYQL